MCQARGRPYIIIIHQSRGISEMLKLYSVSGASAAPKHIQNHAPVEWAQEQGNVKLY